MKNFLIFSAQYLPHMGGVENYTYHLAKKLTEKGNKVTIVTSNVEHVKSFEKRDGILVYRFSCFNFVNGRFPVMKTDRVFWKINRILSAHRYDFVVVNTRFYIHSLYGLWFAKKNHCRCIVVEHGTGHLMLHNAAGDFMENIYEHAVTAVEKMLCSDFYGVSEACLDWLKHFHIRGKGVLYNAVDIEKIRCELENPVCSYREIWKIPDEAVVISFTGRLLKEKGILTLIRAIQDLNDENLYLLIAGDGDEERAVKEKTGKNIIALGRITSRQVFALLKETDIFCLPSDSEGMPTSVLEAAACRNYIITTRQGGARELLLDDSYGKILDSNLLEPVKKAIAEAAADGEMRRKAAEKTYDRLNRYFTWDKVADDLLSLAER